MKTRMRMRGRVSDEWMGKEQGERGFCDSGIEAVGVSRSERANRAMWENG